MARKKTKKARSKVKKMAGGGRMKTKYVLKVVL